MDSFILKTNTKRFNRRISYGWKHHMTKIATIPRTFRFPAKSVPPEKKWPTRRTTRPKNRKLRPRSDIFLSISFYNKIHEIIEARRDRGPQFRPRVPRTISDHLARESRSRFAHSGFEPFSLYRFYYRDRTRVHARINAIL